MKSVNTINTKDINKINSEYYFVKPFEIVSSYSSFAGTWKVANKVCKDIKEVSDLLLFQCFSDYAKYGYITFSKWDSKESFINSIQNNLVLKYQYELNGNGLKSATNNLYKLVSENYCKRCFNRDSIVEVILFENGYDNDNEILKYWDEKCNTIALHNRSVLFFKSVNRKSKYRYLGLINSDIDDENELKSVKFEAKTGFNVYSSFFKLIKKL